MLISLGVAFLPRHKEKQLKKTDEVLVKLDNMFQFTIDHPTRIEWIKNAILCCSYKEGDQWSAAEKAELKKRHQPPTVNNQVKVTIDRMVGQFVKNETRVGYRGRSGPEDVAAAETLTDIYLYIKQNNGLGFEERDQAEDGFTCGFGVMEAYISYDDMFQPEIILRAGDPLSTLFDPHSKRYDWNEDAAFVGRYKWLDVDEAKELYPSKAGQIATMFSNKSNTPLDGSDAIKNDNYIDEKKKRIRIVEMWYKVKEKKSIIVFDDPTLKTIPSDRFTTEKRKELDDSDSDYREIDRSE